MFRMLSLCAVAFMVHSCMSHTSTSLNLKLLESRPSFATSIRNPHPLVAYSTSTGASPVAARATRLQGPLVLRHGPGVLLGGAHLRVLRLLLCLVSLDARWLVVGLRGGLIGVHAVLVVNGQVIGNADVKRGTS